MYNIPGIEGGAEVVTTAASLGVTDERAQELWETITDLTNNVITAPLDEVDEDRGAIVLNPAQVALKASRKAKTPGELVIIGIMSIQAAEQAYNQPMQALSRLFKRLGKPGL